VVLDAANLQDVPALVLEVDDPRRDDISGLLQAHLDLVRGESPPEDVHALDLTGLLHPGITFVSARRSGALLGVGALRELDPAHGELKSMHTAREARGQGVGRAVLNHLLGVAQSRGYDRVSLETGTTAGFAAARAMYARAGFEPCVPFGKYGVSPYSLCMTTALG